MAFLSIIKFIGAVAYPPGSIYCTTKDIDPTTLWGGTWEKLEGKFLLGSSSSHALGTTGGEETHKLVTSEMPAHSHNHSRGWKPLTCVTYGGSSTGGTISGSGRKYPYIASSASWWAQETPSNGGNGAHNNMPPYVTVHMWVRTALKSTTSESEGGEAS